MSRRLFEVRARRATGAADLTSREWHVAWMAFARMVRFRHMPRTERDVDLVRRALGCIPLSSDEGALVEHVIKRHSPELIRRCRGMDGMLQTDILGDVTAELGRRAWETDGPGFWTTAE